MTEKRYEEIAGLIALLDKDPALRQAIVTRQRERIESLRPANLCSRLPEVLRGLGVDVPAPGGGGA